MAKRITRMKTKSITCSSIVEAQALNNMLAEANIKNSINDGAGDWIVQRVPNQAVEVIVSEEDYERALTIYESLPKEENDSLPWCPKCGSEEVEKLPVDNSRKGFLGSVKRFISKGFNSKNYVCKKCGYSF